MALYTLGLNHQTAPLDVRERVTAQDARIAKEVKAYRATVAKRKAQLIAAREQQADVVQQRAAERAAIEAKLTTRKQLLASVQAEVQKPSDFARDSSSSARASESQTIPPPA